jgi:hypothetical protein
MFPCGYTLSPSKTTELFSFPMASKASKNIASEGMVSLPVSPIRKTECIIGSDWDLRTPPRSRNTNAKMRIGQR